jgi:Icc-related predicted phosphoesterase
MKIVFISDTHGNYEDLAIPDGDVLIHAGDFTSRGHAWQVEEFLEWFTELPHKNKIFIAGNHDITFDREKFKGDSIKIILNEFLTQHHGLHYLENTQVEIDGVKFWGSPITPWFFGEYWAFNKHRGDSIRKVWEEIPADADVIITHGPVMGIHDLTKRERLNVGCQDLKDIVDEIKPMIHVGGHIHEGYGILQTEHTLFINASRLDEMYSPVNDPIVVEIDPVNKIIL